MTSPHIRLFLSLFLAAGAVYPAFAEPHGDIPKLKTPVKLDGKVDDAEWSDAARFRRIWKQDNRVPGEPETEFRLKYDQDALYVAAVGTENDPGYPAASPRGWNDLLFPTEDSFSVVLGLADRNVAEQAAIDMGGYDGAMGGKAAKADFYYAFTVNAAASRQRAFNEMPLENALFESAVSTEKGKRFTAEFKIPFRSLGFSNPEGKTIHMNLFRFRPPEAQAWNHKRFKGYSPMPFGTARFLPEAENAKRTVEETPSRPAPAARGCRAELQYSPLTGAIVGKAF